MYPLLVEKKGQFPAEKESRLNKHF